MFKGEFSHGILPFLRRFPARRRPLLPHLRQRGRAGAPLPQLRGHAARWQQLLQLLRHRPFRRSGAAAGAAPAPGRTPPGPPAGDAPWRRAHHPYSGAGANCGTAPHRDPLLPPRPFPAYPFPLSRIPIPSPAPCSAFSARTEVTTPSRGPGCTATWNLFP